MSDNDRQLNWVCSDKQQGRKLQNMAKCYCSPVTLRTCLMFGLQWCQHASQGLGQWLQREEHPTFPVVGRSMLLEGVLFRSLLQHDQHHHQQLQRDEINWNNHLCWCAKRKRRNFLTTSLALQTVLSYALMETHAASDHNLNYTYVPPLTGAVFCVILQWSGTISLVN